MALHITDSVVNAREKAPFGSYEEFSSRVMEENPAILQHMQVVDLPWEAAKANPNRR